MTDANYPDPGPVTPGWRFLSIGLQDDDVDIAGHDPWQSSWDDEGYAIVVAHPSYPWQRHDMPVYRIGGSEPPAIFAAGEVSNNVWTFWVPDPEAPAAGA